MEAIQGELTRWELVLVRQVRTLHPEQLKAELEAKRYRHHACFEALVERAESLLRVDPELASTVAREARQWVERHEAEEPESWMCALSVLGEALSRSGRAEEAKSVFEEALALESTWTPEVAVLWWRYAFYLGKHGAVEEAVEWSDKAVEEILEHGADRRVGARERWSLAAAWLARGEVGWWVGESASKVARCYLAAALAASEQTPVTAVRACHGLALTAPLVWMSEDGGLHPWKVLRRLHRLDGQLQKAGQAKHSPSRGRVQWVQAMALAHLGQAQTPQSESYAREAKRSLTRQGSLEDLVLLNLDLAYILLWEGLWSALIAIAGETVGLAASFGSCETRRLRQWHESVSRRRLEPAVWESTYLEVRRLRARLVLPEPEAAPASPMEVAGW